MIFTLTGSCFIGGLLLALTVPAYLFFYFRSEISALEMRLLARDIELKASIKEQIKGGIDFHIRELGKKQITTSLKRKLPNENKA